MDSSHADLSPAAAESSDDKLDGGALPGGVLHGNTADLGFTPSDHGNPLDRGVTTLSEVTVEGAPTPNQSQTPPPVDSGALTKEEILTILSQAKDMNDAKLNLGLGPVSDSSLSAFLHSKGFDSPEGNQAPSDLPAIGPDLGGQPLDEFEQEGREVLEGLFHQHMPHTEIPEFEQNSEPFGGTVQEPPPIP
jgi:hypothetical protein